ncbi:MAG: NADP-dependent oxidoreductase [Candidatus Eremiobacteraeota bacterium]|nr:NADP-dependent oxidoreductase [Candidatus Eremiobacteraeota bacterium]
MQQTALSTMKALVVDAYGPPENARVGQVEVPKIRDGFLLVRMRAAGVNPFDYKLITGAVKDWVPLKFPYVPGMDGSGEVAEIGNGVQGWNKGDGVVAMFPHGTFAEYALISADEKRLARKPDRLDFKHAAAIPEAGLTARTIVRTAGVGPGQTVLIIGASGGVGLFATQLAKAAGAHVVATGTANDVEYLGKIGADEVVDYNAGDTISQVMHKHVHGVDAVIDVVHSGEELLKSAQALREDGTLVSTLYGPEQSAFPNKVNVHYIQLAAEEGDLDDLARRAADGTLRVEVGHAYDLSLAPQALADLMSPTKHTRGKFVVTLT